MALVALDVRRLEVPATAYGSWVGHRRVPCERSGGGAYRKALDGLAGGDTVKDAHGDPHARLLR